MTKTILTITVPVFAGLLLGLGVLSTNISAQEDSIPSWIKNTAGFWADNQISDIEFMNAIEFLIGADIIKVPNAIAQEVPEAISQEVSEAIAQEVSEVIDQEVPKAIPQAVAQIETPQPLTFYVVEGYELENESKVICDKGDTAISGGWDIEEEWKDSVPLRAETNHPFKTSEDLSYYDGWQFSYEKTQDWSKKTLYVVCADTNL